MKSENCGPICVSSKTFNKYFFLIFMCLLGFGDYFCYESPNPLQQDIKKYLNINNEQFALFYSIPNWVNVPMGFLGGFLVDKYLGINWGAIICCCFTITGQLLFGFGMLDSNYYIMLVGRFLFGVGGEVLVITNNLRAVKWFRGKELNMVFGLQLSVARAGGTLCINSLERIFNIFDKSMDGNTKTGLTLMIGSITVIIDLLIAILLFFREKCSESNKKDDYFMDQETMKFSDVFKFKFNFWLVILVIMFYFVSIFTFIAFGISFFKQKYHFNSVNADLINSIIYIISGISSPLIGLIIGKIGHNIHFVLISAITTLIAHLALTFTQLNPWYFIVLIAISYSTIACTIWPMISTIVHKHNLGTAFGIGQAAQNLSLAIATWIGGIILDKKGYFFLQVYFVIWVSFSIVFIIQLVIYENNKPPNIEMLNDHEE